MDAGGGDAIAADAVGEEVAGDGEGHGKHGTLGHGVGEAVGKAGGGGDGGEVEDDAGAGGAHMLDGGAHAEEGAANVDVVEAVEVCGRGGEHGADVGDAGGVDEDAGGSGLGDGGEGVGDALLVGDVARDGCDLGADGGGGCLGGFGIQVEQEDLRPGGVEGAGDGVADAAGPSGDDGAGTFQAEGLFRGHEASCGSLGRRFARLLYEVERGKSTASSRLTRQGGVARRGECQETLSS